MARTVLQKLMLGAAAAAMAGGVSAPAAAGGVVHVGYTTHFYGGPYYRHGPRFHHYYGPPPRHRAYRHHHYHRRHGGDGAAIALGVIGGALILSEIAEANSDRRAYEAGYDDASRRYAPPPARRYDDGAYERGFEEGYAEGRARSIEDGPPSDLRSGDVYDDDLDARLAGGVRDDGPAPIRYAAGDAYQACMIHARAVLADRGYMLAAPAAPDTAEADGGAWRLTANVTAQNRAGEGWSRALYCEADADRVYVLELI